MACLSSVTVSDSKSSSSQMVRIGALLHDVAKTHTNKQMKCNKFCCYFMHRRYEFMGYGLYFIFTNIKLFLSEQITVGKKK